MGTERTHRRSGGASAAPRFIQGDQNDPRDQSFLGWSFDPALSSGTPLVLTNNTLHMTKVWLPRSVTVTNVVAFLGTTGSALTAGANFGCLIDSAGNVTATADQTTPWGFVGLKVMALTAPVALAGGPGAFCWVGLKSTATTPPAFVKSSATQQDLLNANLVNATFRGCHYGAKTFATTLDAAITPGSNTKDPNELWVALS